MQLVVVIAVRAAVMEDPLPSSPFMGRCSDTHATGDAQGGQNSRQNGDYRLNDEFPSFFFHGILFYRFNNSFAAAIVSSDIKRRLSMTAIAFMSAGHSFSVSLSFPPKLVSLHTAAM